MESMKTLLIDRSLSNDLLAHPDWWATMDRPDINPGDQFIFDFDGVRPSWVCTCIHVVVANGDIELRKEFHVRDDFGGWYVIVFEKNEEKVLPEPEPLMPDPSPTAPIEESMTQRLTRVVLEREMEDKKIKSAAKVLLFAVLDCEDQLPAPVQAARASLLKEMGEVVT